MNKIISLDDKLKMTAREKAEVVRKRKIMAVRQVFQCTHCASKCERCGTGLSRDNRTKTDTVRLPYHFCDACSDEYLDYIHHLQGKADPEAYWHNHSWLKAWSAWIEYQGAVDQYVRSKEFQQLIGELRPDGEGDT